MEDHRRGGGGKNKKRKNKRRRDPRKPPQGSRGPPLTPVLKVTVRKISSDHGDAESVASMIRDLIRSANEKLSVMDPKMVVDEAHLQQLIHDEKVAVAAALQWKEQKEKEFTVSGEAKAEEDAASTAETVDETKAATTEKNTTAGDYLAAAMDKSLQIADGNSLKNQITTRVLYMVPSKKSRRRGEKPGIAYLVLTSPPIETLAPVAEPMNSDGCDNTIASSQSTTAAASVTSSSVPPPPALDYSRDVAKRRLMLQQALVAMQAVAAVDATNNADAMIVEESINAKTWKQYNKMRSSLDRMAGAIFETDDYQQFLEKTVQDEEQRRARPKPAPGGGMTAAAAGTMGSNSGTDASGQPVAALVLHLQKKQEEEKRRKQAKRKAKDSKKKKVGPARSNVPADAGDSGTGGKDANKKRGRRPKKKRGPSNGKYTEISKPSGGG